VNRISYRCVLGLRLDHVNYAVTLMVKSLKDFAETIV